MGQIDYRDAGWLKMNAIVPAPTYTPCDDLWVITTYFNPAGYRAIHANYQRFAAPLRAAGIPLVTVECAFGDAPFRFEPGPQVIQVRGRDVMWLKERLINVAVRQLPPHVRKIAWIDADILFCNADWAVETARILDTLPLAQPCAAVHRLDKDADAYRGRGYYRHSFACQFQRRPESPYLWGSAHGFPGFAWAAQRELIERHGLYDAEIVGGGDELLAHAAGGGLASRCVKGLTGMRLASWPRLADKVLNRLLRIPWPRRLASWFVRRSQPAVAAADERFYAHYLRWAQPFAAAVDGRIGCAPGLALHLWHGDPANRGYGSRTAIMRRGEFDPAVDLRLNAEGVWEWASDKPALHREVRSYFDGRREDG